MCFSPPQEPAEERPQAKSTGVFQDEELLFSQTEQKDNDPDFDLFTTSGKSAVRVLLLSISKSVNSPSTCRCLSLTISLISLYVIELQG